jgi:hypothetical protein
MKILLHCSPNNFFAAGGDIRIHRYFIKQIVNRVIEVNDQTIQDYQGDYNVSILRL